jgi:uncharacterized membrane protein
MTCANSSGDDERARHVTALAAVIFPYATTASAAAEELVHLELSLAVDRGAVATVSCDDRGDYRVTTNHPGDAHDARAVFWFLLLNALILVPVSGTLTGLDRRALAPRLAEAGIDRSFQRAIREDLGPGTSALFPRARRAGSCGRPPLLATVRRNPARHGAEPARRGTGGAGALRSPDRGRGQGSARRRPDAA